MPPAAVTVSNSTAGVEAGSRSDGPLFVVYAAVSS
jgi:hypothetical protein